jgi:bacteriocin-like protein
MTDYKFETLSESTLSSVTGGATVQEVANNAWEGAKAAGRWVADAAMVPVRAIYNHGYRTGNTRGPMR